MIGALNDALSGYISMVYAHYRSSGSEGVQHPLKALKQRTLIMVEIDAFYLSILHARNLTELRRKSGLGQG